LVAIINYLLAQVNQLTDGRKTLNITGPTGFPSQNLHQRWRLEKPVNRSKRIEMGAT
jgi:hypothetical protein